MYFGFESEGTRDQADAEAEIAGAGDDDAMFGEEGQRCGSEQGSERLAALHEALHQGDRFNPAQELVDSTASLHRSGHGKVVVGLYE